MIESFVAADGATDGIAAATGAAGASGVGAEGGACHEAAEGAGGA